MDACAREFIRVWLLCIAELVSNHRVASTPELVTKKYQVNEEDDDVNGR